MANATLPLKSPSSSPPALMDRTVKTFEVALGYAQSIVSFGWNSLRGAITGLVSAFSRLTSTILGAVRGALTLMAVAIKQSAEVAEDWSRNLAKIRANTGIGFNQGYNSMARMRVFGFSPSETVDYYGDNPLALRLRGALLGVKDPTDVLGLTAGYQRLANRGPLGRMFANQALDVAAGGKASDQLKIIVNMPLAALRRQESWRRGFDQQVGMNPNALERFATEIPLLQQRIGYAVEQFKLLFISKLGPYIEQGLTLVTRVLSDNADRIVEGIKSIAEWLAVKFPPMVMRFASRLAGFFGYLLEVMSKFLEGLALQVPILLKVADSIINVFSYMANVIAGTVAAIAQAIANLTGKYSQNTPGKGVTPGPAGNPGGGQGQSGSGTSSTSTQNNVPWWRSKMAAIGAGAVAAYLTYRRTAPVLTVAGGVIGGAIGAAFGGVGAGPGALSGVRIGQGLSLLASLAAGYVAYRTYRAGSQLVGQVVKFWNGNGSSQTQNGFFPQPGRSPAAAYAAGSSLFGTSNMAANPAINQGLQDLLDSLSKITGAGSSKLYSARDFLKDKADEWDKESARYLADIARDTSKTAQNTAATANSTLELLKQWAPTIDRISAMVAEDAVMSVLR